MLKELCSNRLSKTVSRLFCRFGTHFSRPYFYMVVCGGSQMVNNTDDHFEARYDLPSLKAKLTPDVLGQIDKDITRTYFPEKLKAVELEEKEERTPEEEELILKYSEQNEVFRKICRNVLIAYSALDPNVGYVQGFNSIVASLIYIYHQAEQEMKENPKEFDLGFKLEFSEEEIFYNFYGLMFVFGWRVNFINNMDDISRMCDSFKDRLQETDDKLFHKLFDNSVNLANKDSFSSLLRIFFLNNLHAHNSFGTFRQNPGPLFLDG